MFSVAQARLAEKIRDSRQAIKKVETVEKGRGTVENLAEMYLDGVRKEVSLKPASVHYREQLVTAIIKTWPELSTLQPKSVTESECLKWSSRFSDLYSGTRYNNGVDTLRALDTRGMPPEEVEELISDLSAWCDAKYGRQTELAARIGVSKQLVANWLAGR